VTEYAAIVFLAQCLIVEFTYLSIDLVVVHSELCSASEA
jgi:hypothetical protein